MSCSPPTCHLAIKRMKYVDDGVKYEGIYIQFENQLARSGATVTRIVI